MIFEYTVTVEVAHAEGKFASRSEIGSQIEEALADADPAQLDGDDGGSYSVELWEVAEVERKKGKR